MRKFAFSFIVFCVARVACGLELTDPLVLLDYSREQSLAQVQEMEFSSPADDSLNFGFTSAAVWVRMDVTADEADTWWCVVRKPRIPLVDFFAVRSDGTVVHMESGMDRPFEERAVTVRDHVFPLALDAGESVRIFVRAESSVSLQVPISFWTPDQFLQTYSNNDFWNGFYLAYLFALVIAGLALAAMMKNRVGVLQSIVIFSHALLFYCMMGYGESIGMLWADFWSFKGVPALGNLGATVALIYIGDLFELKKKCPRFFQIYRIYYLLELSLTIALLFNQSTGLVSFYLKSLSFFAVVVIAITAVMAWKRYSPAYYHLAGSLLFFVFIVLQTLVYQGVIPSFLLVENTFQVPSLIYSTMFILALNERARMIRLERDFVKAELLEQTRTEARRLQQLVDERTAELIAAKEAAEAANEQKSWFIANVSHDLRAPISSLISLSNVFNHHSRELKLPERFNRFLGQLRAGGDFLMLMLNNILDFSALEMNAAAVRPERLDLKEWSLGMTDLIRSLAETRNISVQCECVEGEVEMDRTRLSQILLNLAQNAVKFSPDNSAVRIQMEQDLDQIELTICDQGPGIAKEKRERIFDLFARGVEGPSPCSGVGLGLNIVRRNVELLGGNIQVDDGAGSGSCFIVQIPLIRAK